MASKIRHHISKAWVGVGSACAAAGLAAIILFTSLNGGTEVKPGDDKKPQEDPSKYEQTIDDPTIEDPTDPTEISGDIENPPKEEGSSVKDPAGDNQQTGEVEENPDETDTGNNGEEPSGDIEEQETPSDISSEGQVKDNLDPSSSLPDIDDGEETPEKEQSSSTSTPEDSQPSQEKPAEDPQQYDDNVLTKVNADLADQGIKLDFEINQ